MAMTSQFAGMTLLSFFFWRCLVSLFELSYWSKFHINIITGSGFLTIFFYKRFARNPEIANNPVCVLYHIWRLAWVWDTKFGANVSNEMFLNAAKCQAYSFYDFWVIKEKPTGVCGGSKPTSTLSPRLG